MASTEEDGRERAEERLVLRAQAGDPVALDQLLRRYEHRLFRHVYRLMRDKEASYDALQDTYIAILRSIRKLRSRSSFRPWAYGVATRTCLKALSRRYRREESELAAEPPDLLPLPDCLASAREELEALMDHVLLLSPRLRAVILLHYFEELTLRQVAAALELSIGTVKSRLAAGLTELRRGHEIGG
jgi:RNA polymerase sigma-70 factor (ECF subfamily)